MGDPPCWAHLFDEDDGRRGTISDAVSARLLRDINDAIIVADREETIVFWNHAAERVFGWTASEAVGQSLDLIVPERHRAAHTAGYKGVMETGVTRYADDLLRVPCLHRSGERRSIAFTVTMITDAEGRVEGVAASVRDETERWQEEKNLKAQVQELKVENEELRRNPSSGKD